MTSFRFFKHSEFECPHCGKNEIKDVLLIGLDRARALAQIPFVINSGYRCAEHNRTVGGKPTSAHLLGYACDIGCLSSKARMNIVDSCLKVGFNRIGIAKTFIHVDCDPTLPPEVMWVY